MRRYTPPPFLLAGILLLAGCATLFTGNEDRITFESEPAGADIFIDGIKRGETPATLEVERPGFGDTYVTFRLEGYEDRTFQLRDEFNYVSILNLGSFIGWGIDILSGAVAEYEPQFYSIELEPVDSAHALDALPRDDEGRYVVPASEGDVVVYDAANGLTLRFEH